MESQLDIKNINLEPNNTPVWQIAGKVMVWVIVWLIIAFLVFAITVLFNTIIQSWIAALSNDSQVMGNPVLPIIFLLIAFISSLVWNIIVSVINNLMNSNRYYDLWKIISLVSISNIIIFFAIAPIYMIFWNNILGLFIVVWFHNIFSVFVSYSLMEYTTNPNYSASTLIWTTFGVCAFMVIFLAFYDSFSGTDFWLDTAASTQKIKILISIPPLLSYTLMPLCYTIRERLYYKFYEMWNNFFYIPSLSDVAVTSDQQNLLDQNNQDEEDDINIEL